MDVNEVLLPGIGLRYEFDNADGDRIGVIAKRTGDFEVVIYPANDQDCAQPLFRLTEEEADTLAQILGAPRIAERFVDLTREVPDLDAGQVSALRRWSRRSSIGWAKKRGSGELVHSRAVSRSAPFPAVSFLRAAPGWWRVSGDGS